MVTQCKPEQAHEEESCGWWWLALLPLLAILVVWLWQRRKLLPCCMPASSPVTPPRALVELPIAVPPVVPVPVAPAAPDDLKRIEGIGPKISTLLQAQGIRTYVQLAATDAVHIRELLTEAGIGRIADPTTWPEQAALAAHGDWDGLAALQSALKGGRRVTG